MTKENLFQLYSNFFVQNGKKNWRRNPKNIRAMVIKKKKAQFQKHVPSHSLIYFATCPLLLCAVVTRIKLVLNSLTTEKTRCSLLVWFPGSSVETTIWLWPSDHDWSEPRRPNCFRWWPNYIRSPRRWPQISAQRHLHRLRRRCWTWDYNHLVTWRCRGEYGLRRWNRFHQFLVVEKKKLKLKIELLQVSILSIIRYIMFSFFFFFWDTVLTFPYLHENFIPLFQFSRIDNCSNLAQRKESSV